MRHTFLLSKPPICDILYGNPSRLTQYVFISMESRERLETDWRREGHVKTEAESGMMWPQAQECQQAADGGRGREQSLPWGLQKEISPSGFDFWPSDTDFRLQTYRPVKECVCALSYQPCSSLCYSMDCSPPGSSVRGILQARILEWVAIPSSRGSSWPRNGTYLSCIGGRFFTIWDAREAHRPVREYICVILS